ncbi:MAG TPA: hypothetical protein VIX19_04710 [Terriglobales bacterium]
MAIKTKSAEELGRKWEAGSWLAVRTALERPRNRQHYDWGLGFATGNLRKLTRKANSQAIITLSAALVKEAGLKGVERVLVLPLSEGGLLVRAATEEDVSEAHARYSTASQPDFPAKAPSDLPEVEKPCRQCGLTFRTQQQRRVYCDACKLQRHLESHRTTWHKKGKLWPSYQRKLKGHRRTLFRPATVNLQIPIARA